MLKVSQHWLADMQSQLAQCWTLNEPPEPSLAWTGNRNISLSLSLPDEILSKDQYYRFISLQSDSPTGLVKGLLKKIAKIFDVSDV